jgi:hypothetical protein
VDSGVLATNDYGIISKKQGKIYHMDDAIKNVISFL